MKKPQGTYSSTDPCDECGKPLRDCNCVCIKHLCCGGGVYYEGHLTDCPGIGKAVAHIPTGPLMIVEESKVRELVAAAREADLILDNLAERKGIGGEGRLSMLERNYLKRLRRALQPFEEGQ